MAVKSVDANNPNPRTGMYDMMIAVEPGDRVVLIQGRSKKVVTEPVTVQPGQRQVKFDIPWKASSELVGWGVLDARDRVKAWWWLEDVRSPEYTDVVLNVDIHLVGAALW